MNNLPDQRRVLITGGTGSVGRMLINLFASHKYHVTFQYCNNKPKAEELSESFGAEAIYMDFLSNFSIPRIDYDIIINNAGVNISNAITHEVIDEDWNNTLLINVTVPFKLAKLCLPSMVQKGWGRIINISSIYGLRAAEKYCPYNVSKHAMSGLTRTIAREYASYGITCNEICPGTIDSEMVRRIGDKKIASEGITMDEYLNDIRSEIPAGRMANPQDVGDLALFLASEDASYLNGASIPLDGGMIA